MNKEYVTTLIFFSEDSAYAQIDTEILKRIQRLSDGHFQCTICPHTSNQKGNMINHVEAKHIPGPGITCYLCQKHSATRQSYRMHLARNHGIKSH